MDTSSDSRLVNSYEKEWLECWLNMVNKKPSALQLFINSSGSGEVTVSISESSKLTKSIENWIERLADHLNNFPKGGECWVIANIDGWSFGSGNPTFYSSTTVTPGGASGALLDNFCDHYVETIDIYYHDECPIGYEEIGYLDSPSFNLSSENVTVDRF